MIGEFTDDKIDKDFFITRDKIMQALQGKHIGYGLAALHTIMLELLDTYGKKEENKIFVKKMLKVFTRDWQEYLLESSGNH